MLSPPIPPTLGHLGNRPFSFYPPVRGVRHNQWHLRQATWSELLVVHAQTGEEVSIPRRFVGEISVVDDPVVIVGLLRELEYREGAVWPCQRRVIEMPVAVGETAMPVAGIVSRGAPAAAPGARRGLAPVVGIRLEPRRRSRVFKIVGGALALAMVLHVAVAAFSARSRAAVNQVHRVLRKNR
jgi:hypothetical protein